MGCGDDDEGPVLSAANVAARRLRRVGAASMRVAKSPLRRPRKRGTSRADALVRTSCWPAPNSFASVVAGGFDALRAGVRRRRPRASISHLPHVAPLVRGEQRSQSLFAPRPARIASVRSCRMTGQRTIAWRPRRRPPRPRDNRADREPVATARRTPSSPSKNRAPQRVSVTGLRAVPSPSSPVRRPAPGSR